MDLVTACMLVESLRFHDMLGKYIVRFLTHKLFALIQKIWYWIPLNLTFIFKNND